VGVGNNAGSLMRRTVFILGAGSSAVFDFPTGQKLCQLVCDELRAGRPYGTDLRENGGFRDEEITRFCHELRFSAQPSVDAFLEHRPDFLKLGKAAMAVILVKKEASSDLWSFGDNNWMRYMFSRLNASFESFHEIPVSFITFNYDRSLEHFLCTTLQNRYRKTEAECAAVLERIPIIHLHGRLGYLPWEKGEGQRPYLPEITEAVLETCVKNIKVVHEDPKDGRDKFIYCLGFGYGRVNVERLKISSLEAKVTFGTGTGLTHKEISDAVRSSGGKLNPLHGVDCIGLLRNYVEWD
jgi:hypothetical protein